ncbi:multiheme c-type cytochrome [Alienimonas californiensis]|uniref:Cytochrome c-554 n=1 Tax=Alienimonas californiensis TaxID=2527989 RepID=A0A517PEY7_9PLAN|nr:multiheme c-type cytochrome [Alienimonas californiensis]QDT17924.1 Cytochrome c-554 precursor [Alienimonas californiensis]
MSSTDPAPPADATAPSTASVWPQILVGAAIGAAVLGLGAFILSRGAGLTDGGDDVPSDVTIAGGAADPYLDPLAAWEKPTAAVVLTGEVHGYLEPCGCSEKQNGGVARRSALFKELRDEKGWDVVAADLGGTVRRNRLQTELKFAAMRRALDQMGYGVLNLGPEELRLGADYLVQHVYDAPEMIAANLSLYGDPTSETAVATGVKGTRILEAGGLKIGFAGVVGDTMGAELNDPDATSTIGVNRAPEALPQALEELADCDVRVLLSQALPEQTAQYLKDYPGFHVAVTAGGPEDPSQEPEVVATPEGEALMLRVGHKGKYAGVLGVYPPAEGADRPRLTYALATLSKDRYGHDRSMDPIMASYQQSIADNLEAIFEDLPPAAPPRPGGYVGAAKCGECHTKAYAKWKESPHAHALASLTEGRENFEGDWADRRLDPECLSCHVTGWDAQGYYPYEGGYLPERLAGGSGGGGADGTEGLAGMDRFHKLQAQQCENCHGPGSGHVATFEQWKADPSSVSQAEYRAANKAVHVELATAAQTTCVKCHDGDNSPEFNFAEYWPKIAHPWRD